MKKMSIGDIVFFMIALTVCYLAIIARLSGEQFLAVVGTVFGAYYVHKAQNKGKSGENNTNSHD